MTEEFDLDYQEISSVPPLPLWILLNVETENTAQRKAKTEEVIE